MSEELADLKLGNLLSGEDNGTGDTEDRPSTSNQTGLQHQHPDHHDDHDRILVVHLAVNELPGNHRPRRANHTTRENPERRNGGK